MKATEAKLLEFLKKSPQFVIPIYQRTYSWTLQQCQQLWDDIIRAGNSNEIPAHFIGSVVYIEQGLYQVSSQSPLLVIDGQQRLTTITLLLEALARALGETEPVSGFSAIKLRHYYLLNPLEGGELEYKLLLTQTDKDSLLALLKQKNWPENHSLRVCENFEFFTQQIQKLGDDLVPLCHGINKLLIVDVSLSREQDNPQLIFESMNSTGKALSQADLIRNFVLMGLEQSHQTRLYRENWRPMEVAFGQEGYSEYFDGFMRHYLTVKTGEIPRVDDVYEAFKAYSRLSNIAQAGVDALVADLHAFAGYYCAIALDKEPNKALALAFQDLRELKVDVAFPFLLELYHDYTHGLLSADDFVQAVRLIESYAFRRAVCAIPTNSMNKTFATFARSLKKDRYLESIKAHFISLPSYRRFPTDEEFKREIQLRNLYSFRSRSYWLRRLENFGRKELAIVDEYTIEHILPQNENLSYEWQKALGDNWQQVQEELLHTLGNLTLTAYNSEYSDKSFIEKRDMEGGFKHSPLKLNEGLGQLDDWNERTIKQRAEKLADKALLVWKAPSLNSEILLQYQQDSPLKSGYTLADHPFLAEGGAMHALFLQLRKSLLAMDIGVVEEILKLYIAFKAETNFVDVVPQKNRLVLMINIPFHELNDPRGISRDISGIGRWGNGDVEVGLSSANDLPYVLGLARQAFERQMGID